MGSGRLPNAVSVATQDETGIYVERTPVSSQ
jgi:hypothetical protein